jgi:hypothetical protein
MKLRGLILLFLVVLCAKVVVGQEFTGRVTDQTGAAVGSAAVQVHNLLTGVEIATKTNQDGVYTVPYLNVGDYSLTVTAPGFEKFVKSHIRLEAGKTGVVNFVLKVGAVDTTVTVDANVDLDAGKADRGEVVENTRVTELPLNSRDPEMLTILNAGVTWTGSLGYQRPFDSTQTNTAINGGGNANNELNLDGVSNDSGSGNGVVGYVPPVDAVQEFKIITNPYDAQYGRGQGGVEDVVLKSGTNQLHGDVYEFARRGWLDADTWQNDYVRSQGETVAKGQHKLDQYGAELDGPVVLPHLYNGRDKTFFVLQFENYNEKVPNTILASVPSPQWLTGDFSNLTYWTGSAYAPITIYDPLTLKGGVRSPFTRNNIPSARINPVAKALLSYYPAPNVTPPNGTNPFSYNYFTQNPTTDTYRNVLAKLDHNLGEKDRFSLRYGYWERWEFRGGNGMPGLAWEGADPFGQHGPTFATDWVHAFSSSLIFDLRASVIVRQNAWKDGPQNFPMNTIGWDPTQMGTHMPNLQISEFAGLGNGGANTDVENAVALLPSVTWIKRNHTFHFGADLRDLRQAIKSTEDGPVFWFDRQWTQSNYVGSLWSQDSGNSIASMLLGTASTDYGNKSYDTVISQAYWTRRYFAPFVQDDWKVTHKLTLNLGIRYDINTPIYERHNRVDYAFDPTVVNPVDPLVNHSLIPNNSGPLMGAITFAGVNGNPRSYYAQKWNNVQPRVGLAYALTDTIVLRGGFGVMFKNPTPGGNTLGWSATTNYTGSFDNGQTPANYAATPTGQNPVTGPYSLSNPYPSGVTQPAGSSTGSFTDLGNGPWFVNPKYQSPGIYQFSAGMEQEFLHHDTLEISYVGSRAFHQDSSDNINHWASWYQATCNPEMGGTAGNCNTNAGLVTNPFQNISAFNGSNYYAPSTIQYGNLTRPYPEFGDVTEYQLNAVRTWYNSLQVTGVHRQGKELTLHGTWTWSKLMGKGGWADTVYRLPNRWIDGNDFTHRITISGVYQLPVGRGRTLLSHSNRLLDAAIGGWELGSLFIYQTGSPWGMPGGMEYQSSPWVPRTTESTTGYKMIRGVNGCIADPYYIDSTTSKPLSNDWMSSHSCSQYAFKVRPPYAATPAVTYTGVRIPSDYQFDSNLSKNFEIVKDLKAQFRLEAFNVFNHPLWQSGYDSTVNSSTFGAIPKGPWGQSNFPRYVQLALKLMW